jgi:hypothetical protein
MHGRCQLPFTLLLCELLAMLLPVGLGLFYRSGLDLRLGGIPQPLGLGDALPALPSEAAGGGDRKSVEWLRDTEAGASLLHEGEGYVALGRATDRLACPR